MVKRIISPRHYVERKEKRIEFDLIGDESSGCTFPADDWFNPVFERGNDAARKNYEMCVNLVGIRYYGPFERTYDFSYMSDAVAECECGKQIVLFDQYMGASQCPYCGKWHNMFGQTLIPPECWEDQ